MSSDIATEIRRSHIKHEAGVRSISVLYYAGSVFLCLVGISSLMATRDKSLLFGAFFLVLSLLYFKIGRWFHALDPKAKLPATILSVLGLLAFPIGTLVSAYVLYLIYAEKGRTVFSEPYQAVIEATPDIRYKTSKLVWFVVILFGLFMLLLIVAVLSRHR